jgi:hypothetical protein
MADRAENENKFDGHNNHDSLLSAAFKTAC